MTVYQLNFCATDCPGWSARKVVARNFHHAYQKALAVAKRDTEDVHRQSAKGKKEDRVSKSFRIDVESIEVIAELS